MKKLKCSRLNATYCSRGFTLIELIVVFSIIAILSSVGIASFVSYSRTQSVNTATQQVTTALALAKSRAMSGVKPVACTQDLKSYSLELCKVPQQSSSNCQSGQNDYEIQAHCGNSLLIASGHLPQNVTFGPYATQTTTFSLSFPVLSGQTVGAGSIVVCGWGQGKKITIDGVGNMVTAASDPGFCQ